MTEIVVFAGAIGYLWGGADGAAIGLAFASIGEFITYVFFSRGE